MRSSNKPKSIQSILTPFPQLKKPFSFSSLIFSRYHKICYTVLPVNAQVCATFRKSPLKFTVFMSCCLPLYSTSTLYYMCLLLSQFYFVLNVSFLNKVKVFTRRPNVGCGLGVTKQEVISRHRSLCRLPSSHLFSAFNFSASASLHSISLHING